MSAFREAAWRAEPFGQQATPSLIRAMPAKRLTTSAYADDLGAQQKPDHDRRVHQQGQPQGRLGCGSNSKQQFSLEGCMRFYEQKPKTSTGGNRDNGVF